MQKSNNDTAKTKTTNEFMSIRRVNSLSNIKSRLSRALQNFAHPLVILSQQSEHQLTQEVMCVKDNRLIEPKLFKEDPSSAHNFSQHALSK